MFLRWDALIFPPQTCNLIWSQKVLTIVNEPPPLTFTHNFAFQLPVTYLGDRDVVCLPQSHFALNISKQFLCNQASCCMMQDTNIKRTKQQTQTSVTSYVIYKLLNLEEQHKTYIWISPPEPQPIKKRRENVDNYFTQQQPVKKEMQ
jgi:hypothetical protein